MIPRLLPRNRNAGDKDTVTATAQHPATNQDRTAAETQRSTPGAQRVARGGDGRDYTPFIQQLYDSSMVSEVPSR